MHAQPEAHPQTAESAPATRQPEPTTDRPDVLAVRKGCDADGMGLSHYILLGNDAP